VNRTPGRTWKLWAYRYEGGKLWHVGARQWVTLHQLDRPLVPVLVEEVIGDPYAPEVTHYAWESSDRPERAPAMVQVRTGKTPGRAMMFLDMCFPYGLKAAIEKGDGKVLALRITERIKHSE
jgi:hypothetical protein